MVVCFFSLFWFIVQQHFHAPPVGASFHSDRSLTSRRSVPVLGFFSVQANRDFVSIWTHFVGRCMRNTLAPLRVNIYTGRSGAGAALSAVYTVFSGPCIFTCALACALHGKLRRRQGKRETRNFTPEEQTSPRCCVSAHVPPARGRLGAVERDERFIKVVEYVTLQRANGHILCIKRS